jgi:hypothetical protein
MRNSEPDAACYTQDDGAPDVLKMRSVDDKWTGGLEQHTDTHRAKY